MADWRDEPATERQREYARDLGVAIPDGATKGEASDLISAAQEKRDSRMPQPLMMDVTGAGHRSFLDRIKDFIALSTALVAWLAGVVIMLIAISLWLTESTSYSIILAFAAVAIVVLGTRWRRLRRKEPGGAHLGHIVSDAVHAKRGTFDESYFVDPKTKRFRFPKYKHDKRFMVRITDNTDYRGDIWDNLDAEERREYTLRDLEMDFCVPDIEVEGFEALFYKSTTKHLEPLSYLKGQWGLVQSLIEMNDDDWFTADKDSTAIQRLLDDGYLLSRVPATPQDKLSFFKAFKVNELRQAAKVAGVQAGRNKQETIDRMIESGKSFDLPPAVVPHPRFIEWLNDLVKLYVDDIKVNADRFHPLYIPEIWDAALDANGYSVVDNGIREVKNSRYWTDRLKRR